MNNASGDEQVFTKPVTNKTPATIKTTNTSTITQTNLSKQTINNASDYNVNNKNNNITVDKAELVEKPVLVLINPISGTGASFEIFNKNLLPKLNENSITHEVFISQGNFRVSDYLSSLSLERLTKFRALVVVSGDGLFHEVINSLMRRQDYPVAMNIPLGIVPAGSGNGLAYTLIRRHNPNVKCAGEAISLASQQIIDGYTCQADLVKVSFSQSEKIVWSFLSIGWGLMADIDLDSEKLRVFGAIRFTVYGLIRCVTAKTYRGRLSYKVANCNNIESNNFKNDDDGNKDWTHVEDIFSCVYAVHQTHISKDTKFAPDSKLCDDLIYLTYVRGKLSCMDTATFLTSIKDGSHSKLPYVTVVPVTKLKLEPLEQSRIVIDGEDIDWKLSDGSLSVEVVPEAAKLLTKP